MARPKRHVEGECVEGGRVKGEGGRMNSGENAAGGEWRRARLQGRVMRGEPKWSGRRGK